MAPDALRFIRVGYVDEFEIVHDIRITEDAAQTARENGWMVLDDALLAPFNGPKLTSAQGDGDSGDGA